jgi:hypothetical protein
VGEVSGVVGAEVEAGEVRLGQGGKAVEKSGLEEAVFVVARLGPRVGKEDVNLGEARGGRQGVKELGGVGFEKIEIGQGGAVAFAQGALDALGKEVHAEAIKRGARRGEGGEEMSVPAAEFQHERGGRGHGGEAGAQCGNPPGAGGAEGFDYGGAVFWDRDGFGGHGGKKKPRATRARGFFVKPFSKHPGLGLGSRRRGVRGSRLGGLVSGLAFVGFRFLFTGCESEGGSGKQDAREYEFHVFLVSVVGVVTS